MSLLGRIENFFQPVTGIDAQRHALRMSANIPATYVLVDGQGDVRQANIVNISRDGVALEILELPPGAKSKVLKEGADLRLKAYLRGGEGILDFNGRVRWVTSAEGRDHIGVQFTEIDINSRVLLLAQALRRRKRRYATIAVVTLVLVCALVTVAWGVRAHLLNEQLEQELKASEAERGRLIEKLKALENQNR